MTKLFLKMHSMSSLCCNFRGRKQGGCEVSSNRWSNTMDCCRGPISLDRVPFVMTQIAQVPVFACTAEKRAKKRLDISHLWGSHCQPGDPNYCQECWWISHYTGPCPDKYWPQHGENYRSVVVNITSLWAMLRRFACDSDTTGQRAWCLWTCVRLFIPSLQVNHGLMRCFLTKRGFTDEWAVAGWGEFGWPWGHVDTMVDGAFKGRTKTETPRL